MPVIYTDKKEKLPKRAEKDFYPTPYKVAFGTVLMLKKFYNLKYGLDSVIDPGAGTGVWGCALQEVWNSKVLGVDIRDLNMPDGGYYWWKPGQDFLHLHGLIYRGRTAAIGNPPFSHGYEFIQHCFEELKVHYVGFLLPSDFLFSEKRMNKLYTKYPLRSVTAYAKRISFTGGSNPSNYSFYFFDRTWRGKETVVNWINVDTMMHFAAGKMQSLVEEELIDAKEQLDREVQGAG